MNSAISRNEFDKLSNSVESNYKDLNSILRTQAKDISNIASDVSAIKSSITPSIEAAVGKYVLSNQDSIKKAQDDCPHVPKVNANRNQIIAMWGLMIVIIGSLLAIKFV